MNGIKMSDCKFYVNEEKRTVVCVIPDTEDEVKEFIWSSLSDINGINLYRTVSYKLNEKLTLPNSFIGKAVCAPEDEWNEEVGRKLAFARAKNKLYTSFFKRATLFVRQLDEAVETAYETFNNFGAKVAENHRKLVDEISDKIEPEE